MPRIIDYAQVLATLTARGMTSLYHNSGSFGFPENEHVCGWIGPDDPTIHNAARAVSVRVPVPFEENLARTLVRAWTDALPGKLWIMPGSHWSYELDFGNADWLPDALRVHDFDPAELQSRTNAAAIEFDQAESAAATTFVTRLLERLDTSDFAAAFPDHPVTCVIHHHVQLWWRTNDVALRDRLLRLPQDDFGPNVTST
jgi:hypothetical protein